MNTVVGAAGIVPAKRVQTGRGKAARMSQASSEHIAVIGGGVTGVTTAYELARSNFRVTLFDRLAYPAMETSFANGGQLSASNAEVWNSWATLLKGLKWMLRADAPLHVGLAPTWRKLSWLAQFVAAIPQYERNTVTTVRLALESQQRLHEIAREEAIEYDCESRGILHFYKTKAAFDAAAKVTRLLAEGGLERRAVTPEEMRIIEPALGGDLYGGFYTQSDFSGDVHKFTNGLAQACRRRGVTMLFDRDVRDVMASAGEVVVTSRDARAPSGRERDLETSRFDGIVVCSGIRSRWLARRLSDHVNIYPIKGYSITVTLDEGDRDAAPWVSLLDDEAKIVASRFGESRFRIAGTAELNGENTDIRTARIEPLAAWCRANFPAISTRQYAPWAGLRPMTPTMLPRVGQGRRPRVFYNTGHGHLGWTLAAATAHAVAACVAGAAGDR